MSVCVYYYHDHIFPQRGEGCSQKWELQCLYMYIFPLITYFPNMERVAHRNESCNVWKCILFLWSHFPQHGGGCSQKWELQCCLHAYIIPLITYFHNMEGVSHRNENCNVCMCILFLWSPISPTWRGLLREMRIAMSVCVYYSFDHLFPQHWGVCSQKWESQCICVYYYLDHLFPQHGGGCWEKWELQCLCVYIIPLVTYFANMEWVLTEMRIAMYMCILFPWSLISPNIEGFAHINENCNVYVYVIPLVTYFP